MLSSLNKPRYDYWNQTRLEKSLPSLEPHLDGENRDFVLDLGTDSAFPDSGFATLDLNQVLGLERLDCLSSLP